MNTFTTPAIFSAFPAIEVEIMVGKLLLRGMIAGLISGLVLFCFLKVYGEPSVDRAIAFEEQHTDASAGEPEIFSRHVQTGMGLLTGVLVYGAAVGGLLAIAVSVANGRLGRMGNRELAMVIAIIGVVSVVLVPLFKYPPNPPAVGSADTIDARTTLFFIMMGFSVLASIASILLYEGLTARMGGWNAALVSVASYLLAVTMAGLVLPSLNEVPENFSPIVLWNFRLATFAGHILFWSVLGIAFGFLSDSLLGKGARLSLRGGGQPAHHV